MEKPTRYVLFWDILVIALIYAGSILLKKPQTPAVFLLILVSLNLLALYFRFASVKRFLGLIYICMLVSGFIFDEALYFALPFAYLLLKEGKTPHSFLVLPFIIAIIPYEWTVYAFFGVAFTIGKLVNLWQTEKTTLLKTIDGERKKVFEIQNEHAALLESQAEISRISAYSERDRIASRLHDDLGHEMTAGLLNLKAYKNLKSQGKENMDVLDTALRRFEKAASDLKDTVHNTKPLTAFGRDVFENQIEAFDLEVNYAKTGDFSTIKPHHWQILNSVLKESFTNVLKHSKATTANVALEATGHIIRLSVENDQPNPENLDKPGYGLSFMRKRIEASEGTLSVHKGHTYKVLVTLPVKEDE